MTAPDAGSSPQVSVSGGGGGTYAPPVQPAQQPVPTPEGDAPVAPPEPEQDLPDWAKDKVSKANREAQNLRARLKELEPIAQAAREAEEAKKDDLQRANERAAALEKQLADATLTAERNGLAAKYGIPETHYRYIVGASLEEREDAAAGVAEMLQARVQAGSTRPPTNRPVENLRPGASPPPPLPEDNSYPAAWGFQPERAT